MQKKLKYSEAEHYLEGLGEFNTDYLPQSLRFIPPDGAYVYERKGFFRKAASAAARTVTFVFGGAFSRLFFGTRVKGRENLKGIKGAICISNHVHWLDTLFVKQAVGHYRSYHTAAPWNNRKGAGGAIMRAAGLVPFASGFTATKNFNAYLKKIISKGAIVNFYPEASLWLRYERPRPFKSGAFRYAAAFGVPVVPLFITFGPKKRFGKKKVTVNILPPVYPDERMDYRSRAEKCALECYEAWYRKYEEFY